MVQWTSLVRTLLLHLFLVFLLAIACCCYYLVLYEQPGIIVIFSQKFLAEILFYFVFYFVFFYFFLFLLCEENYLENYCGIFG